MDNQEGQPLAAEPEALTQLIGRELLQELRSHRHISVTQWLTGQIMGLSTADVGLKTGLFRFVDVLPTLDTPAAVANHLDQYLQPPLDRLAPIAGRPLSWLTHLAPARPVVAGAARLGARLMAGRFIAGRTPAELARALRQMRSLRLGFTVDLLGEAVISEEEADAFQTGYLELLGVLTTSAQSWPGEPRIDAAPWGMVPRVNISVKLSALCAHFDPMAATASAHAVKRRLRPILHRARELGAFVNVDMEQYDFRDLITDIFCEILMEPQLRDWPDAGIVVQAYLRDADAQLERLSAWAKERGTPITVRLVKGAYWDHETVLAAQRGYMPPVWEQKHQTDAAYETLAARLLAQWRHLRPALATHNVRSAAHALALAQELHLPPGTVEFQVLHGMGEPLARTLAARAQRVRVYMPCGDLLPGMAYLVRRLLENTSNDSFVRQEEQENTTPELLLRPPSAGPLPAIGVDAAPDTAAEPPTPDKLEVLPAHGTQLLASVTPLGTNGLPAASGATPSPGGAVRFSNEPPTDFSRHENRAAMVAALQTVKSQLGREIPIVINGLQENSGLLHERLDPADRERVVSRSHWANEEQARRAVVGAALALPQWSRVPVAQRAAVLREVAAELAARRLEIAAWQVYEVGKPWREADGDVAEAIDFCRYYAAQMEQLAQPLRLDVPGEWNDNLLQPRGVSVVIAPWNFPLAILTGMSMAALVAGNTVVLKPSEQSAAVGYLLYEALDHAARRAGLPEGLPPGTVQFLPGSGEVVGPVLVEHPQTALIAFTGSRDVGLDILQRAAKLAPGQRHVKHVVVEMGGKNAVIVDQDADMDEAVAGVLASATGYAGQKCSAASRVIVVGEAYEPFCRRLSQALRSLQVGPAEDPATQLPPVVDAEAATRIRHYLEVGKEEGRLLAKSLIPAALETKGHYVPAALFADCPPDGHLCQEELFGPVLCILHARDLSHALELAQDSQYNLTGGFYSRSPANIERVRTEFCVGNLYINHKTTGAQVGRQPFGGTRLSGAGTQAGGPWYLLQFVTPRTVTESVMRRGFAPER